MYASGLFLLVKINTFFDDKAVGGGMDHGGWTIRLESLPLILKVETTKMGGYDRNDDRPWTMDNGQWTIRLESLPLTLSVKVS